MRGGAGLSGLLVGVDDQHGVARAAGGFLTVYALALWMLGLVFRGITDFYIYAATVLFLLPVVVSLMAKRSLALFNKRFK